MTFGAIVAGEAPVGDGESPVRRERGCNVVREEEEKKLSSLQNAIREEQL